MPDSLVFRRKIPRATLAGTRQEDCKVEILTAKDAKSAKEMLAMGIFQGVLLGALGVLGGSIRFMGLCSSPGTSVEICVFVANRL